MKENLLHFLCEETPFEEEIGETKIIFYPGPCGSKTSDRHTIGWVKDIKKDPTHLHIGIAHGSVRGIAPELGHRDDYFPMSEEVLRASGMDFWLLGHIHVQHPRVPSQSLFYYASTPTPDGFDKAEHDGYVWYLEVNEDKRIKAESLRTGGLRFADLEREIASLTDFQRLKKELTSGSPEDTLLRLNLSGSLRSAEQSELFHAIEQMKEQFALFLPVVNVKNRITQEDIDKEFVPQSLPHRVLTALKEDEDALQLAYELLQKAQNE
jgi:DNA repair exonuclease SbcCD nuclease subunit